MRSRRKASKVAGEHLVAASQNGDESPSVAVATSPDAIAEILRLREDTGESWKFRKRITPRPSAKASIIARAPKMADIPFRRIFAKVNAIRYLLGEQVTGKYVLNETSNPKCWTIRGLCGIVGATKEKLETEVS